jgi:GT2 family glycosyltransferase
VSEPSFAWVVLTQGARPDLLADAVRSIAAQSSGPGDVVVVANGAEIAAPPPARTVRLPENVGIPAGRNVGWMATDADFVFFLDDDATVASADLVARTLAEFDADPRLGIQSFRVSDPRTGSSQRRHVPRLRSHAPDESSLVTTFLGGACAMRRAMLVEVGGYPDGFFYSMEESDLAWRALDAGWRIRYRGDLTVHHPATTPARHHGATERTARNRVWLARRRLPLVLALAYVVVWTTITTVRARSLGEVVELARGIRTGVRTSPGDRRPMRWATALRMTHLGRPPVV